MCTPKRPARNTNQARYEPRCNTSILLLSPWPAAFPHLSPCSGSYASPREYRLWGPSVSSSPYASPEFVDDSYFPTARSVLKPSILRFGPSKSVDKATSLPMTSRLNLSPPTTLPSQHKKYPISPSNKTSPGLKNQPHKPSPNNPNQHPSPDKYSREFQNRDFIPTLRHAGQTRRATPQTAPHGAESLGSAVDDALVARVVVDVDGYAA